MSADLRWISDALGAAPLAAARDAEASADANANADLAFAGFEIDSRRVKPGQCFVALAGERVDGHAYVAQAQAAGAVAAIVSRPVPAALPQWVVASPEAALQRAAAAWRSRFDLPLVGITGSNGKTTTRALTAAVVAARGPVCATTGNLNNHLGVPLMLSRLQPAHRTAVIEMGANHLGDIARLAAWARPQIGVITQAGDAHLEGFGSREAIARGKGELISALPAHGIAVLNADDAYCSLWQALAGDRRVIRFGLQAEAEVRAVDIAETAQSLGFTLVLPHDRAPVHLPLVGRHNLYNALAAAAVGLALGLDAVSIAAGLAQAEGEAGRLRVFEADGGWRVADDSYNANPGSMQAGLDWLAAQPSPRWAVLGAMAELGAASDAAHRQVGAHAAQCGIERLVAVGAAARGLALGFGDRAEWFASREQAISALQADLAGGITVLVKGSRSAGMEQVVSALLQGRASSGESSCFSN